MCVQDHADSFLHCKKEDGPNPIHIGPQGAPGFFLNHMYEDRPNFRDLNNISEL